MPPKKRKGPRQIIPGSNFIPINTPEGRGWNEGIGRYSVVMPSTHVDDYTQAIVTRDPDVQGLVFSSHLPDRIEEPGDLDPKQMQLQPYEGIRPRPAVRFGTDPRVQPYPDTRAMLATSALDLAGGALAAGSGLAGLGLGAATGGLGLAVRGIGTGVGALIGGVGNILGGAGQLISGSANAIEHGVAGAIRGAGDAAAGIVAAYKENQNKALEKAAHEAIAERKQAVEELKRQTNLYNEITRELNRLQNENQFYSQKQTSLETKLQNANAQINLLNQAMAATSVQLDQANAQIGLLTQTANAAKQETLDIKIEANKRMDAATEYVNNIGAEVAKERKTRKIESQYIQQQLNTLQKERNNLLEANNHLEKKYIALEHEKTQLNAQLEQINSDNQIRTARMSELMTQHVQQSLQKQQLEQQLQYLQNVIDQQTNEIKQLNARPMVQNLIIRPPPQNEIQPAIPPIENTKIIKVVITPEKPHLGIVKNPVFFETFNPKATQQLKQRKSKRKLSKLYNKIQSL